MTEAAKAPALSTYIDPNLAKQDIAIDMADITGCMQKQASLYVHYASQTVRAKMQFERQKRNLEILEAKLGRHYRTTLINEEEDSKGKVTKKKPTEPQIKEAVTDDPRWIALHGRMLDAQEIYRLAEVTERAFEQRKDMLLQIARDAAKEREGQLRVAVNQGSRERLLGLMKGATEADAA